MRRNRFIRVDVNRQYGHRLKSDMQLFFESEGKRMEELKEQVIQKNHALGGYEHGYIFNGLAVLKLNAGPAVHLTLKVTNGVLPLDESLTEEAQNYHDQSNKLIQDIQQIMNLFSAAAVRCTSEQDYRDAFPDELWEAPHEILTLSRTRQPGFMLNANKVLERQFQAGVDLLYYHRFNKLIF